MDNKWTAIVVIAVILIVIFGAYLYLSRGVEQQTSPNLTVSLLTLSGKASQSSTLNVSIRNDGGDARGVVVYLACEAFESKASASSTDVHAGETTSVLCNANIKDVANTECTVNISYQYTGASEIQGNSASFQVVPSIEIADVHWLKSGFWPFETEKSTIGRNDNTTLYFKIKSHSVNWTYTDLSASATTQSSTQGLTITPNTLNLEDIGPTGTSKQYSFVLASDNTPPGAYTITIHILSNGQYEATKSSVTLTVTQ